MSAADLEHSWLSIGYLLVEYERACRRGERGRASMFAFWIAIEVSAILTHLRDPARGRFWVRLMDHNPDGAALLQALEHVGPSAHPAGVLAMLDIVERAGHAVPGSEQWNWPLFRMMHERIRLLPGNIPERPMRPR
jgi:hypothetical protein